MRYAFLCFIFLFIYSHSVILLAATDIPPVVVKKPKSNVNHGSKTVITRQEMTSIGATSLSQALQTLGGVQLHDTSGNGSQVLLSMRGFGANASSNTLLMVNGIPITNPDIAPPDLNAIPIQEIEYIEIFAGSESVLYGDQAVGGFINIVTRHSAKKSASIGCSTGSYDQYNCYAAASSFYKQFSYAIGALTNHTDNYRDHNNYDQNLLSGRFGYDYQSGSLEFNYKIGNERMLYPGALTAEQVDQDRRQANNDSDFFKDWNGFYHLRQNQIIHSDWNLETDLARREMHGSGVLFSPFTQFRMINFLKPQLTGVIQKTKLTTGFEIEHDTYHLNTDFGITDDSLQKYGLFVMTETPVHARVSLLAGIRGAQQDSQLETNTEINTINRAVAATIGAAFTVSPDAIAYLRRAGSFRFPKADENASTSPGVHGLKTQHGVAYETGIDWQWYQILSKIAVFQLNLKNEITFDPNQTPQDPFGTNRNLNPTIRRGFSISEKYQISPQLTIGGQYNYVNARFQSGVNAGNRIPLVSENNMQANVNYQFFDYWNVYTEVIYTGNQFPANDDVNIGSPVAGYTIFNTNLRFQYKDFTASFRVNNVFNKLYDFYSVFQGVDSEFFYPAPGRNVLLTLKYLVE